MDIKLLLQAFNDVWLIDEEAANQYAVIANKIRNGEPVVIESKSDLPYVVNGSVASINGNVLVIPISGPIMKYDYCGSPGTQTMISYIESANKTNSIDSIVLKIDSPGGTVSGTEALARAVANSNKPIISFGEDVMGSAAYWGGVNSKKIIISGETTTVGSIGTMARLEKPRNSDNYQVLFASKSTRKNKTYMDAVNGETKDYILNVLDPINNVFTSAVEKARNGKIDLKKEDVTQGDTYIGKKAIEVGLADSIGTLEDAIKESLALAKSF